MDGPRPPTSRTVANTVAAVITAGAELFLPVVAIARASTRPCRTPARAQNASACNSLKRTKEFLNVKNSSGEVSHGKRGAEPSLSDDAEREYLPS
jgi:hypothetical protein